MQCKYCGKETTGETEVCPECEKRIALGESLTEKTDNAKADASVQEENPGDKQTKPEVKPMQRVYGTGNKSWLADRKKEDAEKNKKAAENAGYDNTSGIMFGIISVAAPFLGFMWMIYTMQIDISGVVARLILIVLPFLGSFLLSLIFGLNAIYTFKRANSYGVKPIATLIFGILGTIEAVLLIIAVLILFFSMGG